ncbi:MAG: TonB-dependent receptor [Gemmatimonadota bacterium]|nr:TonB-dependent receptor [Gemmatimonadota bacterium]
MLRLRLYGATLFALATLPLIAVSAQEPAPPTAQQPTPASTQLPTGQIVGIVVDATTGQGLSDVGVQVVGTSLGVSTGVDGRFRVINVPAGTVTIHVRRIGFAAKTVTGIELQSGQTVDQSIALTSASVQLAPLVVNATAERGTVNSALDAQRTSIGVVNSVTAEQISRSADANAAQAVQRVSGVTVQDNKYVFVRGLGERYTTSSLNGARVPSPEPEKRVVPLDMFPAGLLQSITTTKTFTPDLQGDFSGALVDIKTLEFPASRKLSLQLGSGYEAGATGSSLIRAQTAGGERIANVNNSRELPALVRSVGNMQSINLTPGDKSLLVSQFRDTWTPGTGTGAPNMSASASIGGNDPLLLGHSLGYLFSGTYSSGTDFRDGQIRALADRGNTPGETREIDRFVGQRASEGVLWGGLANVSTLLGSGTRLSLNGIYNRTANNDAIVETGSFENEGIRARITRMQYVQRGVRSLQLAGDHQLGGRNRIEWFGTLSGVRRYEPDRSEFVQAIEQDTLGADVLRWVNSGNGGAVRTFSDLNESSREFNAKYQLGFGADQQSSIKIGGLIRSTDRDADTRAYSVSAQGISNAIRELAPEEIFDGRFASANIFDIAPLAQGGSYVARDHLGAAFAMTELAMSDHFRLIAGARYEADRLEVDAFSTLGSPVLTHKVWNDLLPSIALNIKLTETQQLRLSATRTLARPEYRELSPIKSRDVLNGDDTQGNENLSRTRISNFDARWEWYPQSGEVLSLGLFAKNFSLPIERVYRAAGSGTRTVFYTNAEKADNLGVELEARKNLGFVAGALTPFSLFSNLTVMKSTIHLFKDTQASATNLSRRMVGQAPYVVNAGLTYASSSGANSATLLFNRVGDRIDAAGDSPLPDVVEFARNVLDFSLRFGLTESLGFRADAKNILDSPFQMMQGTAVRELYRSGRVIQAGFQIRA